MQILPEEHRAELHCTFTKLLATKGHHTVDLKTNIKLQFNAISEVSESNEWTTPKKCHKKRQKSKLCTAK